MRVQIVLGTATAVLVLGSLRAGEIIKKQDVPNRIKLLKTALDPKVRARAAEELGRRGEVRAADVADAQEPLRLALKDDKVADVRRQAAVALGRIATEGEQNVPALMEAVKDKAEPVKMAAILALGQFGFEAREAIPTLRELTTGSNKKLIQAARQAMKMINGAKK